MCSVDVGGSNGDHEQCTSNSIGKLNSMNFTKKETALCVSPRHRQKNRMKKKNDSIDFTSRKNIHLICSMWSVYDNSITMAFWIVWFSSVWAVRSITYNTKFSGSTEREHTNSTINIHNAGWITEKKMWFRSDIFFRSIVSMMFQIIYLTANALLILFSIPILLDAVAVAA